MMGDWGYFGGEFFVFVFASRWVGLRLVTGQTRFERQTSPNSANIYQRDFYKALLFGRVRPV